MPVSFAARRSIPFTAGSTPTYPIGPDPISYDSLLAVAPTESFEKPRDLEKIFKARRTEPANFEKLLNPKFFPWYLSWAVAFRAKHHVPMYVDQFGAPVTAHGQLPYERALIDYCESVGLHWTRWSFNAGGNQERMIAENPSVATFYKDLTAALPR